tara:strand:- start:1416 stop:2300 length:885 start_codon:yes stop_codon:yes gene_type:complete
MPLQKVKKKKKSKPASDKSAKQVVTQIVKVNIGDTKPKKKRKRKSGGGVARAAGPPPMLAQVPQQFIYPPQSFPQEAPMAPPRQAPPSVEVADPFPVSALNRVLGSVPRSTLAVQPEVQRPTLMRPAEKPQLVVPEQPVMVPAKIKPSPRPPPIGEIRNVEVVDVKPFVAKPKLTGVDRVPIGARDLPESASVPIPKATPLMREEQKSTLVSAPEVMLAPDKEVSGVFVTDQHKAEQLLAQRGRQREATAASRSRAKGEPGAPSKKKVGRKPKLVQVVQPESTKPPILENVRYA